MRVPLAPIARHPRLIVDQRELLADEPVEQRRLADIGPADDRDSGKPGHACLLEFDPLAWKRCRLTPLLRSEEHTSELQSLMRISYAVFCLKKKTKHTNKYNILNILTNKTNR